MNFCLQPISTTFLVQKATGEIAGKTGHMLISKLSCHSCIMHAQTLRRKEKIMRVKAVRRE